MHSNHKVIHIPTNIAIDQTCSRLATNNPIILAPEFQNKLFIFVVYFFVVVCIRFVQMIF